MYASISSVCCQNCGLGFLVVNVDRSIGFSFLLLFVLGLEYIHWGKFQFRKKNYHVSMVMKLMMSCC